MSPSSNFSILLKNYFNGRVALQALVNILPMAFALDIQLNVEAVVLALFTGS
jgi:hypothetical protein